MGNKSEFLINCSGRKVCVSAHRVTHLLGQGFTRVPEVLAESIAPQGQPIPDSDAVKAEVGEPATLEAAPIVLDDLTKSELWALCKEHGVDDQVSYHSTADEMKAALRDGQ